MFDINKVDNIKSIVLDLIQNIEPALKLELITSFIEDNNYLDFVIEKLKELNWKY